MLTPHATEKLIEAKSWLAAAFERADRADDGILRMQMGHETREQTLWAICSAIDFLENCKRALTAVPLYHSHECG